MRGKTENTDELFLSTKSKAKKAFVNGKLFCPFLSYCLFSCDRISPPPLLQLNGTHLFHPTPGFLYSDLLCTQKVAKPVD